MWSTRGCWVACGRAAERRSGLAPLSAESWAMPGRAAETRADACGQGAATLPVQVPLPLRYWLVGGSAVAVSLWVSGFGPGLPSPPSLLATWASTGPGGAPVGGATVVVRPGRAAASFWPALLACSFATFTAWRPHAWRRPASRRAGQDRPAVASTACVLACGAAWVVAGTSHPPPAPADLGCFAVSLFARNETNRGPDGVAPARQAGTASHPRSRIDAALATLGGRPRSPGGWRRRASR
jgi:hypothetical protein